jgi:iron complex transport system substrate-binding protein
VQERTKIPYLLFDGAFLKAGHTLRRIGEVTGDSEHANALAVAADEMLADLKKRIDTVPPDRRPRIYYGRGPRGLETGTEGSINTEVLAAVGAVNVAAAPGQGNLTSVSMEQILAWNPDVVLTLDKRFYTAVFDDPLWQAVGAVKNKRVYLAPSTPFGWLDFPPGLNRLIGARWLAAILYPDLFPEDLRNVTRDFYTRFYHVTPTDDQLDMLLAGATPTHR